MSTYGNPYTIHDNSLVLSLDASNQKSYIGSGTSWLDISYNGNNGTLTNGPTFNSNNGGFIVFDGTNDYVDCGYATNVRTNSITYAVWIKFSVSQQSRTIMGIHKDMNFTTQGGASLGIHDDYPNKIKWHTSLHRTR